MVALETGDHGEDLGVGAALATQGNDVRLQFGFGSARLTMRNRRLVVELRGKARLASALEPPAQSPFADVISSSDGALREVMRSEMGDHFGSHDRGESGISVHVVRVVWRWVWFSSTTSLAASSRADNVLKHDT